MSEVAPEVRGAGLPLRPIAAGLGVFAAGTIAAVERVGSGRCWPDPDAHLEFCSPDDEAEEVTLALPGLGVGADKAELIAAGVAVAVEQPTAYLALPQRNPSAEKLQASVQELAQRKRLNIYGHSLGGVLSAAIAPGLPEGMTIDRLMLDCSPTSFEDVVQNPAIWAARGIARTRYKGGLATAAVVAAVNYKSDTDEQNTFQNLRARVGNIRNVIGPRNCSAEAWTWQLRLLENAKPSELSAALRPRLAADSKIAYFMPEDPDADKTVKVEQAADKWQDILGRDIDIVRIKDGGHGISIASADEYIRAINQWHNSLENVAA